jgi:hypothetical protein
MVVHQETQQRHVQEVATHKSIQERHEAEVVAHTLLINVMEEVYAQVPSMTGETFDLPT